jgi:RimJ/RimL family protein N-acetyltransferase
MSNSDPVLATRRLSLSPLASSDLESVFQVCGDPDTWQHLPAGRHKTHEQSQGLINAAIVSTREHRIGQWAVRVGCEGEDDTLAVGTFIGMGGVNMTPVHAWNLGYRLSPTSWGRGFASEIALAAVAAVRDLDESVPITARVLSDNSASARVAVRADLQKVWEGPTAAAVAPGVFREVFSDRELNGDALQWLVDNG